MSFAKQRKPKGKKIRKAIGKQLGFVERNLKIISNLKEESSFTLLTRQEYRQLLVISELCRQQRRMYAQRNKRIDDRIVSISQPHIRPIVRGKAKAGTEFGAKVNISMVNGYALMENLAWDNYNEGTTLQASAEKYKKRFGHYPEAILADKIYRNHENRQFCKRKGIRLSGPALGRPSKEKNTFRNKWKKSMLRNVMQSKPSLGKESATMG